MIHPTQSHGLNSVYTPNTSFRHGLRPLPLRPLCVDGQQTSQTEHVLNQALILPCPPLHPGVPTSADADSSLLLTQTDDVGSILDPSFCQSVCLFR